MWKLLRTNHDVRCLFIAQVVSYIGDWFAYVAFVGVVQDVSDASILVTLVLVAQALPAFLMTPIAGPVADRHNRRLIVFAVNLARAAVLGVLALTIVTGAVNVAVILLAMFVLGTAEAFSDITTGTLLPMLVDKPDLGVANARLGVGMITLNQLAGPPIGAFLFATGMVWPSVAQAVTCALGAVLVAKLSISMPERVVGESHVRSEIVEGVRWLWHHPPIRTLTLTVTFFNVTFGAAMSVLVLYAEQRLGAGAIAFGLLTTAGAIGGVVGSSAYGWLERNLGMANIMRCGLVIETLTHLTLATTQTLAVALGIFVIFGVHEAAWGTTVISVRQRAVPTELQGRIGSVYMMCLMGGLVIGAAVGGVIAQLWGVTAPFWFAFAGSAFILLLIWRRLSLITHT